MNKYLLRGLAALGIGIAIVYVGYQQKQAEIQYYKLIMTVGVFLFGIGFLTTIYSFFRKIDRHSLMEDRKKNQED